MPNDDNGLRILLIEDDASTAFLMREAFQMNDMHHALQSMPDGEEALRHLRQDYGARPNLICLDLHLPRVPGLKVLAQLKSDPELKLIPVIVVSGANDPNEVREAYALHASCFIHKPNDLDLFLRFIKSCFEFWGTVVTLPA